MIQTITFCQFCDAFRAIDRNDNFSYDAKRLLFDYLENIVDDNGQEYSLDVIALCCEFNEMTVEEVVNSYGIQVDDIRDCFEVVETYLQQHSTIVGVTKEESIVFAAF